MKYCLAFIAATLLFNACSGPKESNEATGADEAKAIFSDAMDVHDEVMPKMDAVMKMKKEVSTVQDSLASAGVAEEQIKVYKNAFSSLDEADKDMMKWMRSVEPVPGNFNELPQAARDSIMSLQREQKESIEEVRRQMNESIEQARELLKN